MKKFKELKELISKPRLEALKGESDSEKLRAYKVNIQASEAIYPALHIFEISLRNKINEIAIRTWGKDWLLGEKVAFNDFHLGKIQKAKQTLIKQRKEATTSRIIAELSLGFWTGLFDKNYFHHFSSKIIHSVFQNLPKETPKRNKRIRTSLRNIRNFRNRIFHYEPILGENYQAEKRYNELLEVITWISLGTRDWLSSFSREKDLRNLFKA